MREAAVSSGAVEMYVAGTGSFAAEIADWARAAGMRVIGLIEMLDESRVGTTVHGLPVIGLAKSPGLPVVLGIGGDRRLSWERLASCEWTPLTLIHPTASLAADVHVSPGATVGPLAVVGAASAIGAHTIVSRGALIGHHVELGEFCTLNPGVSVGGNTSVGQGVFVGIGATVVNGVAIGDGAVVGAGALVLDNVEAGMRVQGVPARAVPMSS
jgi:sugar O-acyltransferase (sialic acid O-acetyltransferase NeuD family)